ncbi:MAG TPA: hypothetical protein VFX44_01365 [Solirubrobacterales bacterium]|nr:hypothetical protein [Solirubrobacterales bacterium]
MAQVLIETSTLGGFIGITIAVLERKTVREVELWSFRGTAIGFLAGLFLAISGLSKALEHELSCRQ